MVRVRRRSAGYMHRLLGRKPSEEHEVVPSEVPSPRVGSSGHRAATGGRWPSRVVAIQQDPGLGKCTFRGEQGHRAWGLAQSHGGDSAMMSHLVQWGGKGPGSFTPVAGFAAVRGVHPGCPPPFPGLRPTDRQRGAASEGGFERLQTQRSFPSGAGLGAPE